MNLINEIVTHKVFGNGTILEFDENFLMVQFENEGVKKFVYPDSFHSFLTTSNEELLEKIENDKLAIQSEKDKQKLEMEIRFTSSKKSSDKKQSKSSSKTSQSNIAFKCNYCDGGKSCDSVGFSDICSAEIREYNVNEIKHVWCNSENSPCKKYLSGSINKEQLEQAFHSDFVCYESQMLRDWKAYAGIVQSGANKGKPMALRSVRTNSLAVLTSRLPNSKDEDRFIFAVFLVDENYEGDDSSEGFVGAHPKFRIQLSPEEADHLKFWNYYFNPNKPEKIVFGSGLHRYLTDIQAAQILNDICNVKHGKDDESLAIELFNHYCSLKGIDGTKLAEPNGGLIQRLCEASKL